MQVQTITTTLETINTGGANFEITTFEMKTEAICDICGEQQTGTAEGLRRVGWSLNSREHFCPNCND